MAERKTIRLHSPVRSGHLIVPENAVVDAAPEIADRLVGEGHAEYTDALERYPNLPVLDVLNDYPITGAEKFPRPAGVEPVFAREAFGTEVDKRIRAESVASVVPAWDHPLKVGDESSPAKPGGTAPAAAPAPAPAPAAAPGPGAPVTAEAFAQPPAAPRAK
jgi:hypothetical protein